MNNKRFQIEVSKNGKLQFYNVEAFQQALLSNKGFTGFIEFQRLSNDSSLETLFKTYNWWLDLVSQDIGDSKENTDDIFCQMFLTQEKMNSITGKIMKVTYSKDSLSYQGWLGFLRKIHHLCTTQLNFVDKKGKTTLPIPNNLIGKI